MLAKHFILVSTDFVTIIIGLFIGAIVGFMISANTNVNDLDNPIIAEAIANIGSRPFGRFGRIRKKRTHVTIITKTKEAKK